MTKQEFDNKYADGYWFSENADLEFFDMFNDLFGFIKWTDEKAYSIQELLNRNA